MEASRELSEIRRSVVNHRHRRRWRPDLSALMRFLASSLNLTGKPQELFPERLWRLATTSTSFALYCGIISNLRGIFAGSSMSSNDEQNPWVIRTCFSDDQTWGLIKKQVAAPQRDPLSGMDFTANVRFVEDPALANLSSHEIVRSLPTDYPGYVAFVVDTESNQGNEHSLLVVGFAPQGDGLENFERKPNQVPLEDIRTFRAIPSTVQSIENNLSIANMDFDDFRRTVGTDGVFRGFGS